MGCCNSIPSSSFYLSRHPGSNLSSRGVSSSQPQSQAALPVTFTQTSSNSDRQEFHDTNQKPRLKKPLERHVWSSTDRIWTNVDLDRERDEFFHTRTSGRPEIWQTLKGVLEILWAAHDSKDGVDSGLGTAQQILDSAEIIVPHSNISPGVYDSFGAYYPIPKHIISNPTNVVIAPTEDQSSKVELEDLDNEEALMRREEKGKNKMTLKDVVKLRTKLSDRDAAPIQVLIDREDSVRLVAKKIAEESNLQPPKFIRIAYLGRILKENLSLSAQGWKDDHVINGLVFG